MESKVSKADLVNYIKFVALYIRKSRGESDSDLEKHRSQLIEICETNNWKYVEYPEIGSGDSIELRPKMKELLEDIKEGIYDAVLVVDYDRLGRGDLEDQGKIKKAFQQSDTLVVTPTKIYNLKDDDDEFIADVKGFLARQEYKQILKRLKQGKKFGARRGDWVNGVPPYPYEYERYKDKFHEKGLVVNDEKLKIYRLMVEMLLEGDSAVKIARTLNDMGIPSVRGRKWDGKTINHLLKNEVHLGKIISNKSYFTKKDKFKEGEFIYKRIENPKSDWVVIENCHKPVKTQEEHDRIIMIFHERNATPVRSREARFAFSGLIKCARCNSGMAFYTKPNGKQIMKPCYSNFVVPKKCGNGGTSIENIFPIINNDIVREKERLYELKRNNGVVNEDKKTKSLIELNEEEKVKKEKALQRVNEAYEAGAYTIAEMKERKDKITKEIDTINEQLEILRRQIKNKDMSAIDEAINSIEKIESNLEMINERDPSEANRDYSSIIRQIKWLKIDSKNFEVDIEYKWML